MSNRLTIEAPNYEVGGLSITTGRLAAIAPANAEGG